MRTAVQRWHWVLLSLAITALVVVLQWWHLAKPQSLLLVTRLESLLYDMRFNALPPKRAHLSPIVIVDIDELSIQREGRWPWDRKKVAKLVDALNEQEALLIGLDIIFSEPSPNAAKQLIDETALPSVVKQWLQPLTAKFDSDTALAEAISGNTVLGYFFHNDGASTGQLPFPFYQLSSKEAQRSALRPMSHYSSNVPTLADAALAQGFVVTVPDSDGVVRRTPLVLQYQDGLYASLPVMLAQLALGAPWLKLKLVDNGQALVATQLDLGDKVQLPVSADGSMLVPFRGYAGAFPTISATRVLKHQLDANERQQLRGAIVLVGTSALGLADLRTIPLQTSYPGVEVHANVLDTILQAAQGERTVYREPDWAPAMSILLLAGVGILLSLVLPRRAPRWLLLWSALTLSGVVGLNAWFWQVWHWSLPLALPLMLVVLLSTLHLAVGFVETNRNKRAIQSLFGEYVPPAYVEQILNHPERASMAGEQREMTVLFADVVGFTSSSEQLNTAELKHWLNQYLTAVTQVIFDHQGTIDKYVGDMVMAFWNAPLIDGQHAQHGVLTALAMQAKVRELAPVFAAQGLPPIAIGIGLNTGLMNVGDMGSSYRRAYTVLGDAVNLGSRLEALTRFYGVDILVSDSTAKLCPELVFWPIDCIRVKGKQEPVEVFEPLGLSGQVDAQRLAWLAAYQQALDAYRRGDFRHARLGFEQLQQQDPAKALLYQRYLERLAEQGDRPPPDWQPVFTHQHK